jgi:hypothetical protein
MQEVSNWGERAGKIKPSEDSEEFCKFNNNKCQNKLQNNVLMNTYARIVSCKFE